MNFSIDQSKSVMRKGEMSASDEDGIFQYQIRDQSEVAKIMGISHQRVQQIERSALLKIRRALMPEWKALTGGRS